VQLLQLQMLVLVHQLPQQLPQQLHLLLVQQPLALLQQLLLPLGLARSIQIFYSFLFLTLLIHRVYKN
jgi:hypothetical protein